MPNRILRDWTDSERVNELSPGAEIFLIRLIMKADDYGCFPANPKLLKSLLYPLSGRVDGPDIALWMAECQEHGLIATYEVDSKQYLQIKKFNQTLRRKRPKYPLPPDDPDRHSTCIADDTQMHSTCIADDEQVTDTRIADARLKRNESETNPKRNEDEVESPPAACSSSASQVFIHANNQTHLQAYFDPANQESVSGTLRLIPAFTPYMLRLKAEEFNNYLAAGGRRHATMSSWRAHFLNWFRKNPEAPPPPPPVITDPSPPKKILTHEDLGLKPDYKKI